MQTTTTLIHIVWTGPHPFAKASEFIHDIDFGIYQIYGSHSVYGSDILLYIGRSQGSSFGWRLPQHAENHDDGRLRVHLGRLAGEATPSDDVWNQHIALAERLLIHAHQPAVNQRSGLGEWESELQNIHVRNWGRKADLLPEVSGVRWTGKHATTPMNPYQAGAYVEPLSILHPDV